MFKSLLQLHSAAARSPGTPGGQNGCNPLLKTGQPLFLWVYVKLNLDIQKCSVFVCF